MQEIRITRGRDGMYCGDTDVKSLLGSTVLSKTKRLFRSRELYIVYDKEAQVISSLLSEELCRGFLVELAGDYRALGYSASKVEVFVTNTMPADVFPYFKKNPKVFIDYVNEMNTSPLPPVNGFACRRADRRISGVK